MQLLSSTTNDTQQHCSVCTNCFNRCPALDWKREASICEAYIGVSIEVFQTLNQPALRFLKDFLTALPTPLCIEQVLLHAVYQLAETNTIACRWLLKHYEDLKPELDLMVMIQQCAIEQLHQQGFTLNQDFQFLEQGQFQSHDVVKTALLEGATSGDRLLFTEILKL